MHGNRVPLSNKNTSLSLLITTIYICSTLRLVCLCLLHNVLVSYFQLLYFLSDGLHGLGNLIYHCIQIIYYYSHFWHYFNFCYILAARHSMPHFLDTADLGMRQKALNGRYWRPID